MVRISHKEEITYSDQTQEYSDFFQTKTKPRTKVTQQLKVELQETSPAPGMPAMPTEISAGREARDAALAKQVVEAVAREMAKAHTHYQPYSMIEAQLQCQPALR